MPIKDDRAILSDEKDIAAAVEGQRVLAAFLSIQCASQRIDIFDLESKGHAVVLPTLALRLLVDILGELANGNAVKVVPVNTELTTQEAADLLNVSRPHLVKILESGALPFIKTGCHRRVRFSDLMAFKQRRDSESRQAIEALTQRARE